MIYKNLIVWQKSMALTKLIYDLTDKFPKHEQYNLASQMRRSAVSIPSNIAEGSRRTRKESRHFYLIAYGSGSELETQIQIAKSVYPEHDYIDLDRLIDEILKMLNKMTSQLPTPN